MTDLQSELMRIIHKTGSYKGIEQSPNGEGFRLAKHETNPNLPLSPYYLDLRSMVRSPNNMRLGAKIFRQIMPQLWLESAQKIADVPTAITPVVATLSTVTNIAIVTPRKEPKSHGTQTSVDGFWNEGDKVIVFDDVVTSGGSLLGAINTIESLRMTVIGVAVLIDRLEGGRELLRSRGHEMVSALTINDLR
jgi:orotate phosphoribosyltransferase